VEGSDRRIKQIKGGSSSKIDLETLKNIEITDYRMKDHIGHGNQVQKKVIAPQLGKNFPQAVSCLQLR